MTAGALRAGRWKGCCPFHGEKTPSFYVYDDHYHCFGCGAHGDAISFVMQSQGAGFLEAVEQLAAEAGMQVPKPTPEAAEAERQRLDLASRAGGGRRPASSAGCSCPRARRGAATTCSAAACPSETIRRFGLGWSGEGRGALAADLAREGVTQDQLVDAGLMRRDDETGRVFDLFFNRVMFPIRDRRGRTISFGGRILGDGQPKYVNGPETALFSKRRTLYAPGSGARGGAAAAPTLVVVEGYMDVIALAQAGFGGAVAPLGTALTEEQLEELWRLSPAPVLCFDGDAAGARAAARAAELALPMLAPDRTPAIRHAARRRGPGQAGAPPGRATAFQAMLEARARWPSAVRPAARGQRRRDARSSARLSGRGWKRRRGKSPTRRSPANTARPCWTGSSPRAARAGDQRTGRGVGRGRPASPPRSFAASAAAIAGTSPTSVPAS